MTEPARVVFLLDVDNTLLDNDHIVTDLKQHLVETLGVECQQRYWTNFKARREELGYADYLGALQRYRIECPHAPNLLEISLILVDYPFAARLFSGTLDVIRRLNAWRTTVILSDLAPFWHKAGGLLFRHGEHFYNFDGLRQYKEKCRPVWEAKCIAAPGGFQIAMILRDIATLISGV